ncbi:MAG TPA: FlgD immunoglobulin-like domain containing protein [Candidatus Krumholzibacteria bacterium]|nr:FlgD immunoglobulin-like domain containing protein [Candidatus Krumholzibacteria bacterium]
MKTQLAASLLFFSIVVHPGTSRAAWVTNGNALCTFATDQVDEAIVSDGAGGAIVVWEDFRNFSNYDIYAQRINASGAVLWTADGVAISTATGNQSFPVVVSDGAGGAIIAWADNRGTDRDIYAQRINAAGVVQWTANGVGICTASRGQDNATIVADGSGGAIITWQDNRNNTDDNVFAQRINSTGAVQWVAGGVVVCSATGDQDFPSLASDGGGGAIIAWQDLRLSAATHIYSQRLNASGVAQWTANGVAICTAVNNQFQPLVTSDGAGGAIVTWNDARVGITTSDIYAQRINSTGTVQWAVNGVALCTATDDQYTKSVATDGAGGVIAAWWDRRSGGRDIYARRIDSTGTPQWTADGVALCTATDEQSLPTIAPDGAGGAIVTWSDNRVFPFDIYAQKVNSAGTVQWTPNGVILCGAADEQLTPVVAADGGGGAIVAWQDLRNGSDTDIYAQRVSSSGTIPTAVSSLTPALALIVGDNYPNPFAAGTSFDVTTKRESAITVDVFDVAGRRVRHADLGHMSSGWRQVSFDGRDNAGHLLPSGVYFYRVEATGTTVTKKMVISR